MKKSEKMKKIMFCSRFVVRNTELTVFDSRTANEGSKNESTTRGHPGRSRSRGPGGHKWPERTEKAQKGHFGGFCSIFVVRNT